MQNLLLLTCLQNNVVFSVEEHIMHDTFSLKMDSVALDILRLDYLYAQRVYHLPRFLEIDGTRQKTWAGDRKTPLVPFLHTIRIAKGDAEVTPAPSPQYYAVVHAENSPGYLNPPSLNWVS